MDFRDIFRTANRNTFSKPHGKELSTELEKSEAEDTQEAPAAGQGALPPVETTEAPGGDLAAIEPEGVQIPSEAQTPTGEPPAASELPTEAQVVSGETAQSVLAPQEGDDSAVALNKTTSNEILESLNVPALEEEKVRSHKEVMARVSADKADARAMEMAGSILKDRRQGTDFEHGAMVLKAGKLMNELEKAQAEQAEAASRGDTKVYEQLTARIEGRRIGEYKQMGIVKEIEILARADALAGRESARAVSIRQLALSRENWDVVDLIRQMQTAKGPEGGELSPEQQKLATETSRDITGKNKEIEQLKEEIRVKDEALAEVEAQKILNALKPKKSFGKGIKERAAAEREDIKKQIRALGHRVNDITGVSAEGAYLIGRLGVTYIKSGVGTLAELVEQLQADMPNLNLTDQDVYQALLMRNPKLRARARTSAEAKVAQFRSIARMLTEIDNLARGIAPSGGRRRGAVGITGEIRTLRKKLTEARNKFYAPDIASEKLERAIATVNQLQDDLDTGKKRLKKTPGKIPPELAVVREMAQQLRAELRVDEELAKVTKQLETGDFETPAAKAKKPIDPRLERKQIELARLKKEWRQAVYDAQPWTAFRMTKEVAALAKSMKATADISFTMRQNLWQVFSHPVRTSKAFIPSMEAFFSEYSSDQIYNSMVNGENGFLYMQSELTILDASSTDAKERSEIFRGNVIERSKLPGLKIWGAVMRASSRHAVTVGNLVRTSAFDAFLVNHPNATSEELTAFADYVNVSTGIGNLGRFGAVADELQLVFFSPKFAVSRFQTPLAIGKHWSQPRVRKEIARDMVKFASTGGMVLALAALAGADVEWRDPDDPDWGKLRIGNTRRDIWGGFLQPARLIARNAKALFTGGADFTPTESLGRFASYKFSPAITTPIELLKGKTAVGEETTALKTLLKIPIPFVYEDIHDAWKEEGAITGAEVAIETLLGVGVNTYQDSRTAARRKVRNWRDRGEYARAAAYLSRWNQERDPGKETVLIVKPAP